MRKMPGRSNYRSIEHYRMIPLGLLQQWYHITTPTFPPDNASLKQREIMRQAHLTSTILLLSIIILFAVMLGAFIDKNTYLLLILLMVLLFQGIAAWLNQQGRVAFAGLLVVTWFMLALGIFLFSTPGRLDIINQANFYIPIEIELLAVSLLPAWSVFLVTLYNALLIEAIVFFKPHTPAFDHLLAVSGYQVSLQPILLQIIVAVVSYLWVQSATQAIQRADRAEEITKLTQTIAEQNRQRMEALQMEQQMKQAYEHQRKLNYLKDQFLINVSHELRTPLTTVEGYLELLKNHHEQLDVSNLSLFITKAIDSCEDLTSLVNRVVEAVYIDDEKISLQKEEIHIYQFVQDTIVHLDPRESAEYMFQIQIAEQSVAWADPHYGQKILHNLLSNIFKYAPKHTTIHIKARQDGPHDVLTVSIQDEGPGIPPEELPHLFEKFVRLKRDQTGTVRGMGLGLYISKNLVEMMGGRIWVESSGREKEGSRFCFTLPGLPQ